jgi:prephenate dehydrogenase
VPTESTDPTAVLLLEELIDSVGARAVVMDAETHDLAAACVSHLAYMLAASLVSSADQAARAVPEVWLLASSGFRDTSRVAAGNIDMIMDILSANKDNVLAMIETATEHLGDFARLLTTGDEEGLREKLTHIRMTRRSCDTNRLF